MRLAREGGRAFVSASLRPYLIAALADRDEASRGRPLLVVVGDDRAARDLAADLRSWLAPRPVRYYPSRGVAYESHLAPPPHLVGLRVAALDALLGATGEAVAEGDAPVVVVSAAALSEKVPDPALRPRSFTLRVGELLDLDECAAELVAAGYERVDQVEERGQFAMRGGLLDVFPATEDRAVRVDMFDVEIESLRWFSTFTQRSLGDAEEVEIAPAAELAPEHRELAELAAEDLPGAGDEQTGERPDIAELLPVERFLALLELIDAGNGARRAHRAAGRGRGGDRARAEGSLGRRVRGVRRHGRAPPLREPGGDRRGPRRARARPALGALGRSGDRAARAVCGHRVAIAGRSRAGARAAGAFGLPGRRHVPPPRRGRARGVQPRPVESELAGRGRGRHAPGHRALAALRRRVAARGVRRAAAEARRLPGAPADPSPARRASRRRRRRRPAPPWCAALVHRPAHRRHRRPRGPRRRPLRGL